MIARTWTARSTEPMPRNTPSTSERLASLSTARLPATSAHGCSGTTAATTPSSSPCRYGTRSTPSGPSPATTSTRWSCTPRMRATSLASRRSPTTKWSPRSSPPQVRRGSLMTRNGNQVRGLDPAPSRRAELGRRTMECRGNVAPDPAGGRSWAHDECGCAAVKPTPTAALLRDAEPTRPFQQRTARGGRAPLAQPGCAPPAWRAGKAGGWPAMPGPTGHTAGRRPGSPGVPTVTGPLASAVSCDVAVSPQTPIPPRPR